MSSSLIQRIASGAIGVPAILALIYLGGNWYTGAVAIVLGIAALEFQHLRRTNWFEPISVLVALMVAGIAVGAHLGSHFWLAWIAGSLVIPPLAAALDPSEDGEIADTLWILGCVTYVGFLGGFLVKLRDIRYDGEDWVYVMVLGTFACDTAAFFVGRTFGRHKLAPRISPKKTIEGFAGGYVAGFAVVVGLNYALGLDIAAPKIVFLASLLPVIATVGDLAESAMKRALDIKDASELIPGHGGFLDRLDSILFTGAFVYLFTQWLVY